MLTQPYALKALLHCVSAAAHRTARPAFGPRQRAAPSPEAMPLNVGGVVASGFYYLL
ncbi:MAG: hypothetical protein M5R42_05535 [Rhodocyclaceae bacterium]|nr:hypothetical protein [Rhodocyclaceae bacterium]